MQGLRRILIADADPEFVATLLKGKQTFPISQARTGKEAQLLLSDKTVSFAGIFISAAIADHPCLSVIRYSHQARPATPIFVLYAGEPPFKKEELKKLGIQETIAKPVSYEELVSRIAPISMFFDPKAIPAGKNTESLDTEFTAEDAGFVPIRAEDFLGGTQCFFDIYVRLGPGRFVKILQAGDAFSPERVQNYLKKGVINFFLKKEEQEVYLGYCDQLATALVQGGKGSTQARFKQTLNHGQETMNFLKNHGMSETNLAFADHFVTNVNTLARQIDPGKNQFFRGFLADVASYEHGVATSMIASLLIGPLRIEAERPVHIIGLACLFHDIGLYGMPEALQTEDETKMSDEQREAYRTHPALGAQILKGIHGLEPVTIQAVAQHHERRNKKGFPARLAAGSINRVAEIVGLSDEFVRLIKRAESDPTLSLLRELEFGVFEGFSPPVTEAFRSVFFPAEKKPKKS